ncbi:MAG: hypothetical protein H6719_21865 [Sandaracinaceae bacterium]|nr:hypothetical protein [Sandaracinaceae bacterium]
MRVAWLGLLLLLVPSVASAQSDPLRALSRNIGELRSDAGQSYAHLRLLEEQLLGRTNGARVTIRQVSRVDPFFRLVSATYALDGHELITRQGDELTDPLDVHEGIVGPGTHTLSVVLRYEGDGHGVVGYLPGYRFVVRSSHTVTIPAEGALELTVRPFTRAPTVPFTERLGIEYEARELPRP